VSEGQIKAVFWIGVGRIAPVVSAGEMLGNPQRVQVVVDGTAALKSGDACVKSPL
jgi:hypothetical protein